jgi:hypothetical protein
LRMGGEGREGEVEKEAQMDYKLAGESRLQVGLLRKVLPLEMICAQVVTDRISNATKPPV